MVRTILAMDFIFHNMRMFKSEGSQPVRGVLYCMAFQDSVIYKSDMQLQKTAFNTREMGSSAGCHPLRTFVILQMGRVGAGSDEAKLTYFGADHYAGRVTDECGL